MSAANQCVVVLPARGTAGVDPTEPMRSARFAVGLDRSTGCGGSCRAADPERRSRRIPTAPLDRNSHGKTGPLRVGRGGSADADGLGRARGCLVGGARDQAGLVGDRFGGPAGRPYKAVRVSGVSASALPWVAGDVLP